MSAQLSAQRTPTARTITIVGSRFAGFAVTADVETVDTFLDLLTHRPTVGSPVLVRVGQGIDEAEWDRMIGAAHRRGCGPDLIFEPYRAEPVGSNEAHKHSPQNTLVADLQRLDADRFVAALRLHNDNELLLDHQTGRHVQGMVCVEAARQMFLAVTERYVACDFPEIDYYYVIDSMDTAFENFLFPLPAEVRMTLQADTGNPQRIECRADISIEQSGRRASRTRVGYTAFRSETLTPIEAKRAAGAVDFIVRAAEVAA